MVLFAPSGQRPSNILLFLLGQLLRNVLHQLAEVYCIFGSDEG